MLDEKTVRWRKALSDFGYPYTLVSGGEAEGVLAAERETGREYGFSPVIVVPGYWNSEKIAAAERTRRGQKLVAAQDPAALGRRYLETRFARMGDDLACDPENPDPALFDALEPREPRAPEQGLLLLREYNAVTRAFDIWPEVALMRISVAESWAIPACLDWGGWNGAPSPSEMAAVARHWREAHGAEVAVIAPDQLEVTVARPPASHAGAVALLREHYAFAPFSEFDKDILEECAAQLRTAPSWIFWWD